MRKLSWYIALGITFIGFLLINHYFTLEATEKIGHINPAFIPIVILIPFLMLSLYITFRVGSEYFTYATKAKVAVAMLFIALIFILAGGTEYQHIMNQLDAFGGTWNDKQSIIYGLSPFNSYTNDWYFNESAFLIIHAFSFLCGIFMKDPITESDEQKN